MSDTEFAILADFVKGSYRVQVEIRDLLKNLVGQRAAPNAAPVQSALPLDEGLPAPGTIMRAAPRVWDNYVRAYDALWREYAARPFRIDALYRKPETVTNATGGKIGVGSFRHILTAIANASAATRNGRAYTLRQPTDELREAVEAQHKGRRGA